MSRNGFQGFVALAGISALTNAAYSAQPPCASSDTSDNTACGTGVLALIDGATGNTGTGFQALDAIVTGNYNSANGYAALFSNTSGNYNTASGGSAMFSNQNGSYNTADGFAALSANMSGTDNTAIGGAALHGNARGNDNVAVGRNALRNLYDTDNNTAIGIDALYSTDGINNTAVGAGALFSNTGNYSSAIGFNALYSSQSGLANIGVGPFAGRNIVAGQLNIDIGSWGSVDESNTIRIGLPQYHLTTFISGIATSQVTGAPVYVTASGQLGVLASSERYKTDIVALGGNADRLGELRPVSFHLKSEPDGTLQYGLIAEEVDKVYPELVIRDKEGKIQGVRYDELAPMLLNEVQKEQTTIAQQARHSAGQDAQIKALEEELTEVRAALAAMQASDMPSTRR